MTLALAAMTADECDRDWLKRKRALSRGLTQFVPSGLTPECIFLEIGLHARHSSFIILTLT